MAYKALSGFQNYVIDKMRAGCTLKARIHDNGHVGIYVLKTPQGVFVRSVSTATVCKLRELGFVTSKEVDGERVLTLLQR